MVRWAKAVFCSEDQISIASKEDGDSNPSIDHLQIRLKLERTTLFFAVRTLRNETRNQVMHKYLNSLRLVNPPEVSYVSL